MSSTPTTQSRTHDVYASSPHSKSVLRQTQALIGVTLLAGTAAAYFVNTAFVAIPLVVGCGLAFAGITGICPMASFIASMPWNRQAESKHRGSSGGCCGGCQ